MALKLNVFIITIELLLVAYILLDIYATIFVDSNNIVTPDDSVFSSNSTNEDPKVVAIGNFAVDQYNKLTNSNLKFQSVVKAVFGQSSYMLLIQVSDGSFSKSKQYGSIVNAQGNQMRLVAFEEYSESDL
ncbi:cysteine proteinase inhibitor 5 [Phtheirospermum japonicum]|uniref:Cysteine proteinase inhibitor 5 n=1 Tax=Phtheirospermum japonicum TaxID=374723 RepID=A0A830DJ51_9LAMI|nr:cysteine proteinase inhibitor 5 [Phtheirospermum japonicum]